MDKELPWDNKSFTSDSCMVIVSVGMQLQNDLYLIKTLHVYTGDVKNFAKFVSKVTVHGHKNNCSL